MDLKTQTQILELSEASEQKPIVLLGAPDPESAELVALTVSSGDPTYSGPLAGVSLGLPVYHVLEDEVAAVTAAEVYEQHIGLMKMALDADAIASTVRRIRETE